MTTQTIEKPRLDRIYEAAQELMLEKGYVATTVDEICEKADVTKGSFFYYFKNKEDFGVKLVQRFAECSGKKFEENTCCNSDDPLDRVYATVDCAIKLASSPDAKGCLVGTFAQELSESHPVIRKLCAKIFEKSTENFKADLKAAKKIHAPKGNFDVNSLADSFLALMQGSLILVKAKQDKSIIKGTLRHYKLYLETLFGS